MVDEIGILIARATAARAAHAEKSHAFGEIVRRFQDLAFACAFSTLGDFHLAEDAAQESFLTAWRNLDQLRQPEAFPGWLKRIVLTQCSRFTRGKHLDTVGFDALLDLPAPNGADGDPSAAYDARERQARALAAIRGLPEHERIVTSLYYLGDYSTGEIGAFLELPVGAVKKRLFSARQRLRERMLDMGLDDMVRETLRERRPSRNEQFADVVALFTAALDSFVERVKQDRYVIAAILFGSLSHDTVWRKSDIDIILVGRDERPVTHFSLVENGVNIHALMYPRSKFKQVIEGSLHGSFFHSSFALSTLLFTTDDSIRAYYQDVRRVGSHDRQMRLMSAGSWAVAMQAKAEKWLVTRGDVAYSFLYITRTLEPLATIEVLLHDELTTREVVPHAARLNPAQFMPEVEVLCQACKGARFNEETLEVSYRGKTIADVLDMSIEDAARFCQDVPLIAHKLGVLNQLGMGYLKLGQSSTTISGGEAQRVKLANELSKVKRGGHNLYILDEPTTGLHLADIQRLLDSLQLLVDSGNTVLVIEHHADVIRAADWVLDLGPDGGARGGALVAEGPPEHIATVPTSWTGQFLRSIPERQDPAPRRQLVVA
jgi:RNA polymerase sigma factor (sigma-70 family)